MTTMTTDQRIHFGYGPQPAHGLGVILYHLNGRDRAHLVDAGPEDTPERLRDEFMRERPETIFQGAYILPVRPRA